jgi:hypothetical protein
MFNDFKYLGTRQSWYAECITYVQKATTESREIGSRGSKVFENRIAAHERNARGSNPVATEGPVIG